MELKVSNKELTVKILGLFKPEYIKIRTGKDVVVLNLYDNDDYNYQMLAVLPNNSKLNIKNYEDLLNKLTRPTSIIELCNVEEIHPLLLDMFDKIVTLNHSRIEASTIYRKLVSFDQNEFKLWRDNIGRVLENTLNK